MKIAFHTLGCKLNFSESSNIAREFRDNGFEHVDFKEYSDIYVINTCTVTENSNKKCRDIIKKAVKKNLNAIIAVVGCYSQLKAEEVSKIPGVDIVLGSTEKFNLYQHIDKMINKQSGSDYHSNIYIDDKSSKNQFESAFSLGDRTRSFLKIQDGCDYYCTYCTIPHARGNSRSDNIDGVVANAKKIAASNVKEIVLTGVNTGDFGRKNGEKFIDLLKELDKVDGIERYRISSIEPNLLTDEIIEFVANSKKFMPHFHIPLQSGSDTILKLMKRRYDTKFFTDRIKKINEIIEDCFIGIDVIVGFPGETDKLFNETKSLLNSVDVSFLHVFTYSERENTKAIELDNPVPNITRKERSKILHNLSDEKSKAFYEKNKNSNATVLFESTNNNNFMFGFTENYLKVKTKFESEKANEIIPVELIDYEDFCFNV